MRKKVMACVFTLMTLTSVGVGAMTASAACSSWTEEPGTYVECDWSDRCGPLWAFPGTAYRVGTKIRYCSVDGVQKKETTAFHEKDGCCS